MCITRSIELVEVNKYFELFILISRLFHGLKNIGNTKRFLNGLALIPSAGGLVSAIYLSGINS